MAAAGGVSPFSEEQRRQARLLGVAVPPSAALSPAQAATVVERSRSALAAVESDLQEETHAMLEAELGRTQSELALVRSGGSAPVCLDPPVVVELECIICMVDYVHTGVDGHWQNGVLCRGTTTAAVGHFTCTDCFRQHVQIDACRPGGRFEAEVRLPSGGASAPGQFPCPLAAPAVGGCDFGSFGIHDIYRACLGHSALQSFNASMLRVETAVAVAAALAADKLAREADKARLAIGDTSIRAGGTQTSSFHKNLPA